MSCPWRRHCRSSLDLESVTLGQLRKICEPLTMHPLSKLAQVCNPPKLEMSSAGFATPEVVVFKEFLLVSTESILVSQESLDPRPSPPVRPWWRVSLATLKSRVCRHGARLQRRWGLCHPCHLRFYACDHHLYHVWWRNHHFHWLYPMISFLIPQWNSQDSPFLVWHKILCPHQIR